MSLKEHLLEFRRRLLISAAALLLGAIAGWYLFDPVYAHLTAPLTDLARQRGDDSALIALNYAGITAAFSQRLSLAIWIGVIISSPVWLYEAWAFLAPGLTTKEKRISLLFVAASVPLFLAGCWFGYMTLPKAIQFLLGITPDGAANLPEADMYFKFVTRFILIFGLAWLLPVFLVGANMLHVIPARVMLNGWRPAVVLIFLAAAIATPTPDPYTMFLMGGPLVVLYFFAVGVAFLNDRRRKAEEPEWMGLADDEASVL